MREAERWESPSYQEWTSTNDSAAVSFSGLERNHLFWNGGGDRFEDVSGISGLDSIADGRGFALFDYDRDGWQDVALVNTNAPFLEIFRNRIGEIGGRGRSIALRLVGGNSRAAPSDGFSNRDGVGAIVSVRVGDRTLVRERRGGEGFAAQNSSTLIVGIGERAAADAVTVTWPSGRIQETGEVPAGTLLTVYEDPARAPQGLAFHREAWRRTGAPPEVLPGEVPVSLALGNGKPAARPALGLYTTMATWCPACKRNIPQVRALREAFSDSDLALFGVPIDAEDSPEMLAAYDAEYAPGYELLVGAPRGEIERVQSLVEAEFARDVLPTSFLTDGDGRVLRIVAGVPTISQVRELLRRRE